MAKESLLLKNLLTPTNFTRDQRFLNLAEESKANPFTPTSGTPIQASMLAQGEMFRYKKSTKELTISRWCILDEHSFRYYKTQFSAICEEKPLFELLTSNIQSIKALSDGSEHALEILALEDFIPGSPISTRFSMKSMTSSMTGRRLAHKPRYFEPRPGKYTKAEVSTVVMPNLEKLSGKEKRGIRENKISWTSRENMMYITEQRLIFMVGDKDEWEKWQEAFRRFAKVEIEDSLGIKN